MTRIFGLFLVFICLASPTYAVEINESGAQTLQKTLQDMLDYQKTVNEAFGSVKVDYEGEINVKQETEYYTVTLPRILLKTPEHLKEQMEGKSSVFDVGVITINATPDEKDDYWKTVWTFPSEMALTDDDGQSFVVTFGEQSTVALLSEQLGYFTKLNANFSNMRFKESGKAIGLNIGNFQIYTNLEQQENNAFSGPFNVSLTDLLIEPPENQDKIAIGELSIKGNMHSLILPTLKEYEEKLLKHAAVFENLTSDEDINNISGQQVSDMIFDLYDFNMSGFDFEYGLKNFSLTSNPKNETNVIDDLKIGSAYAGFGFDGLNAEKGSMSIKTGYADMVATHEDEDFKSFVPQTTKFDVAVKNVPFPALTELGKNTFKSITQSPETAQMVGIGLMMKVPAILSQAGTQILIEKNGAKNDIYDISFDGKLVSDLTAIMGFTAKFKTVFEGLDSVLSLARGKPEHQELTDTLEKLKEIGQKETGPNGKAAYSFTFEATPEGTFLVNGKDASVLSGEQAPPPVE